MNNFNLNSDIEKNFQSDNMANNIVASLINKVKENMLLTSVKTTPRSVVPTK